LVALCAQASKNFDAKTDLYLGSLRWQLCRQSTISLRLRQWQRFGCCKVSIFGPEAQLSNKKTDWRANAENP
jgi:hypothetical protein